MRFVTASIVLAAVLTPTGAFGADAAGALAMDSQPKARFEFSGPVRERIDANLENWLLRAPTANPGMLEMFRGA
jgi:hypothetical protein